MYHYLCIVVLLLPTLLGIASGGAATWDMPVDPAKTNVLKIAAIGPWKIDPTANFMSAYHFLNMTSMYLNSNNSNILPNISLQLVRADTGSVPGTAILVASSVWAQGIIGFIGGSRTPQQQIVSYLANAFQVPHVGGIVTGAILSDKKNYPYFMRTSMADQFVCEVMMKYIISNNWTSVVLVTQNDDYGNGNRDAFLKLSSQHNITTWSTVVDTYQTDFSDQINQIYKTDIRILVFLVQINEANVMLRAIKADNRMVNANYVYMLGQVYFSSFYNIKTVNYTVFDGTITFTSINSLTPESTPLQAAWTQYATYLNNNNLTETNNGAKLATLVARQQWFQAEALYAYAYGLRDYLADEPNLYANLTQINGTKLYNYMRKLNYTGISGQVRFDQNGDRLALCNIYIVRQPDINQFSTVYANITLAQVYSPFTDSFEIIQPITFYNGRADTPRDIPCPCQHGHCESSSSSVCVCDVGWQGAICNEIEVIHEYRNMISGISTALGVIIGVALLVAIFATVMLSFYWEAFRTHGPFYCGVMITGVFFGLGACLMLLPEQTDSLCMAFPWLLGIGFALVYGCLFVKTWTLYKIYRSAEKMQRTNLTAMYIIKGIGIYLVAEVIFLIIWTVVDRPTVRFHKMVDDDYLLQCSASPVFWAIFAGSKLVWLLFGAVLSILTRHISAEYSESKSIAYATYNIIALLIIGVPLAIALRNIPGGLMIVEVGVIVIAFTFTMCSLFFGIWMEIIMPSKGGVASMVTRSKNSSNSSTTQANSKGDSGSGSGSRSQSPPPRNVAASTSASESVVYA